MDGKAILDLYSWEPGDCFQCARTGLETTVVEILHPHHGAAHEVRACKACLLLLEDERAAAARSKGVPYEPGHIAPHRPASES